MRTDQMMPVIILVTHHKADRESCVSGHGSVHPILSEQHAVQRVGGVGRHGPEGVSSKEYTEVRIE
jgi:hypothetical protein